MDISKLINGIEHFSKKEFSQNKKKYIELVKKGQHPKALFIGCSDSRVVPNIITSSEPGDLFVMRNVGNFVPPFSPEVEYHGTAAAIEYAVNELKVSDIIVCGHSHCGAIKGLYKREELDKTKMTHLRRWLHLGDRAKQIVEAIDEKQTLSQEDKLKYTEHISVVFSLQNLLTYPTVAKLVTDGELSLRGWYYTIETGEIEFYDEDEMSFFPI